MKMKEADRAAFRALSPEAQQSYIDMAAEIRALRSMAQSAMGFAMALTSLLSKRGVLTAAEVEEVGKTSTVNIAIALFDTTKETFLDEVRREVTDDA